MTALPERIVEVRIGPPGQAGQLWRNPLHISASVEFSIGRSPNKAEVKMYNLSDASVDWIMQRNNVIYVSAGEGTPGQIFKGDIDVRQVTTKDEGQDVVTIIKPGDGRRIYRESMFHAAYPPGTSRDTVLADVVTAMNIPTGYMATLPPLVYAAGIAWAARARDVLTEILGDDAYWSIQGGALQILLANEALPGNSVLLKADTGMIGSPEKTNKGVNWKSVFNRSFRAGGGLRVESKRWTGDLKVTKGKHMVTNFAKQWETTGMGVPV
jgi:hypothetical protein